MNNQKTPCFLPAAFCSLPACPERLDLSSSTGLVEGLPSANDLLFLETNPCHPFCYELQETLMQH
jgi:hypothetical protein